MTDEKYLGLNISKIYYEDDDTLLCDLVHGNLNYSKLNRNRYHLYFQLSVPGFKYFTLINKKSKYIIHADTERFSNVMGPVLKDLSHFLYQKENPKILFLGLGSGCIARNISVPHLGKIDITCYEIHNKLKPIEKYVLPEGSKVIYTDMYDYKKVVELDKNKYDVIINDIEFNAYCTLFYCQKFMKDEGRMYFLSDWTKFPSTPYNFIKLEKQKNNMSLEDISDISDDIIQQHVNEISKMKGML
jgi:hypothetical protein